MRLLLLIAMALLAVAFLRSEARAAVASPNALAIPATEIVKAASCGCRARGCGGCVAQYYAAYRRCGGCGCGGCAPAYRAGYGYAGYGCGCTTGRCSCGYCYHGCGYGGRYGYPIGYPACGNCGCKGCRLYSYTTGCGGSCDNYGNYANGYYNGGWSVFGWLF